METTKATMGAARRIAMGGLALLGAGLLTGCLGDSPTNSSGGSVPVSVSVTVPRAGSLPTSVSPAFSITVTDGSNQIVMERVELVIRDLGLKPDDVASCDAGECVQYLEEAALLPLPTDGSVLPLRSRSAPVDRYDRLEVSLHAPSSGSPVLSEDPDFEGVSVRVEGTYNDEPFTFSTDVTTEARMELEPAVVLEGASRGANVTFVVGVSDWFRSQGGRLVDPRTAGEGGENESLVESNIQDSFEAFRDDNRDGSPGTTGR